VGESNPEVYRIPLTLSVEKSDGSVTEITGPCVLRGGSNVAFDDSDPSGEVRLFSAAGVGSESAYYRQKFNTLRNIAAVVPGPFPDPDTGITPEIPEGKTSWEFSPESLWISKISGVGANAVTGSFFLGGSDCISPGEFDTWPPNLPQAEGSLLRLVDICVPCFDCQTWELLDTYLQRIRVMYDYIFDLVTDEDTENIPEHPDGGVRESFAGVYPQAVAVLRYWDYLVHRSTVKLSAQVIGQSISLAGFYRNISDAGVGPDVLFTFRLSLYVKYEPSSSSSGDPEYCPWTGLADGDVTAKVLDRAGKQSASFDSFQLLSGGISPPCPDGPGAHTVEVVLSGGAVGSGEERYADVALLFRNMAPFTDEGSYLARAELTVSPVHLLPSGTDTKQTIIYFQPPDDVQAP